MNYQMTNCHLEGLSYLAPKLCKSQPLLNLRFFEIFKGISYLSFKAYLKQFIFNLNWIRIIYLLDLFFNCCRDF